MKKSISIAISVMLLGSNLALAGTDFYATSTMAKQVHKTQIHSLNASININQ
ncbi:MULTISPECIES: hypothetical protein [Cysteiniphilum]|uniref:hypothetical protein n=1 Tax=Cysteiniphilum TaxID=2056696 RepID=UPI00177F34AC|nr:MULTISPECIES: hypothetical protein [Cysteiniphilum]